MMPFIRERRVFMSAIRVLSMIHTGVLTAHLLVAIESLSLMCETEDFVDHTTAYISNAGESEVLQAFKAKVLQPLQTGAGRFIKILVFFVSEPIFFMFMCRHGAPAIDAKFG